MMDVRLNTSNIPQQMSPMAPARDVGGAAQDVSGIGKVDWLPIFLGSNSLKEKFVVVGGSPWRGYPLTGWTTRVNTGANAGSVTLGLAFGGPGTLVLFR